MPSNKADIPNKIELTANDPFIKYLGFMYNAGVEYLVQADKMLEEMQDYNYNLQEYMKNRKLNFLLDKDKK